MRAYAAGATALLVLLVLAGQAGATSTPVSFTQQFLVGNAENQEGLAYAGGVHYVGFDLGGGNGRIVGYAPDGTEVQRSGLLPTGHTNEISVRSADGNLYVTNSSASVPGVAVVDMRQQPPAVLRTIAIPMSTGAVSAVDDAHDQLVVATGPTGGPYSLVFASMTGQVLRKVAIPDEGITQGLEVVGDQILLLTSLSSPARNQLTVFSSTGAVLQVVQVPVAGESEGLAVDPATGYLYLGANGPNRVYKMSPAFTPAVPGSTRVITLNPVADAVAHQQAPTTAEGSAPTLLIDTQETSGTTSRATPYLRFTVPPLAAGESVVAASLSLQVTEASSNGPTVWRAAPSWEESTLTWSSGQPARVGTAAVGGYGNMPLGRRSTSVSGVTGSGDVSLQLYADSSDGLQVPSREDPTVSRQPQLSVTVTTDAVAGGGTGGSGTGGGGTPVAPPAPTVTPASGTYASAQTVTVADSQSGVSLRYTVGAGTTVPADPTASTGTVYTGAFPVSASQVVKAAAFDSAGKASPVTQRTYVISTSTSRTLVLTATADTMARQPAPTTASGAVTTLRSDAEDTTGVASPVVAYLRFTVPALAAGESVSAASLSLQVTNATTDGPSVWRTDPSWSESTLTWSAGQPARVGTAAVGGFGSMATGRRSTAVSGVTASGDVSFQLSPDSGDAVQFSSRETGTAANRPQLVLTVTGG